MAQVDESILIAVLVIVCLIFLFQFELYRNLLAVMNYYSPEPAPPMELRFSQSFLPAKTIRTEFGGTVDEPKKAKR